MNKCDKTKLLGTAPVTPLFLKLAAPAILGQMMMLLNNIVDRIWIGHVGEDAVLSLGAVGLSMPIQHLFMALVFMITSGMAPTVSILLGKGSRDEAAKVSGACLGLAIALNVATFVIITLFADPMLLTFGAGEKTLPFARSYLTTIAWGIPFGHTLMVLSAWFGSQGYVSDGVRLGIMSVLINAVLDPVFIFGLGMGVTGAAVATNLGGIIALAYGVSRAIRDGRLLRFGAADLLPRFRFWRRSVLLGLSTLFNAALESVSLMIFNAQLQRFGGDIAVAAMTLFSVPLLVIMSLCLGLSMGAQPIISFNFGKGDFARVLNVNRVFIRSTFTCSLVIWAATMCFPAALCGCFTKDADLIAYATPKMRLFFMLMLLNGVQYAHIYIIKFLGLVKESLVLGVLKRLVLHLPLIFILPVILTCDKVIAVLMAAPIVDGAVFLLTAAWYLRIARTRLGKTGTGPTGH